MDKVYYLDLQTLLEYLQGQSALLVTEVNVPGQREPCTGYLFFRNTMIIGCLIQAADDGIWREGEQAYQLLKANEEWRVRMDLDIEQEYWRIKQPENKSHRTPLPRPAPPVYVPRPSALVDASVLEPFSAKQRLILRMVLALVNGQRTSEQIKAQLRLPAEVVDEALRNLYALKVIE
ncbi:MAG TPA: hypothetical protein VH599_01295 [Ktedonobacterales bacterium]|jgi:hypothetical protein